VPVREIPLAGKPWEPRFAKSGTHAYVTLLAKNAVAEVDVATGTVVRTLEGRLAQPYGMVLRADNKYAFIVNQNTGALMPGQSGHEMHGMEGHASSDGWLTILDLGTGTVHSTLMLGNGPTGIGAARAR
jgi:DNA-binding beta-propeller fold protein YncE